MTATHYYAGVAACNFKLKAEIKNYNQARAFVQENDPDCIMADLGPNMHVLLLGDGHREVYKAFQDATENWGDIYAVVLYDTEIIRYYPDGTFSVDNGGFNTITTTERLQAVLPDGFCCYHFSTREIKGKLGLTYGGSPWPKRRKVQEAGTLWPLDHSKRITMTGEIVS